jgi:hypothetical protein
MERYAEPRREEDVEERVSLQAALRRRCPSVLASRDEYDDEIVSLCGAAANWETFRVLILTAGESATNCDGRAVVSREEAISAAFVSGPNFRLTSKR